MQFQDENGHYLTIKEVADLIRRWQRRTNMPNVNPDLLPIPIEDLKEMIRAGGIEAEQVDRVAVDLVAELHANANAMFEDGDHAPASMGARLRGLEEGAATKSAPLNPVAARRLLPPPELRNGAACSAFEEFFGRRPTACCIVQ